MDILAAIEGSLKKLKPDVAPTVAGQNKNLNIFRSIWVGTPEWLKYDVWLPDRTTREEKYKTLNVPRYITRTWANNYANEDTVISVPGEKDNELLQNILSKNNFFGKWNNFIESMMGLGCGAIVVNLDKWSYSEDTNALVPSDTSVKIQFVRAERVFPITIDDGEVTECAFATFKTGSCKLVIHWLQEDGKYAISEISGPFVNNTYNFDFETLTTLNINSDIPLFQIWHPNVTNDYETDFGTSILSKAQDAFFQCDVDYTALFKEIKLGNKVKYISTDLLDINTDGEKEIPYDINDESIIAVDKGNLNNPDFKTFTDELRIQQLVSSLNFNMNAAAMLCGLGSNQFEFDGAGGRPIQTATGVIAKQTELYRNVIKQENFATSKLKDMVKAIIFLNNNYTSNSKFGNISDTEIQITYDDNIVEDTDSKKKNDMAEVQAGIMSIAEYRAAWYDEGEDEAKQFVQENGLLVDKYILAIQSHVMTPELFVDIVFGENCRYKKELVEYITEWYGKKVEELNSPTGFEDEDEEEDNSQEEKEEADA